jgi:hypothetical protein
MTIIERIMPHQGFGLSRKSKKSIFPPSEYSALTEPVIDISDFYLCKGQNTFNAKEL